MSKPFTLIAGFDGAISVKLFRKKIDRRFSGNVMHYFRNNSISEYRLSLPLSARWERGNFAVTWAYYPMMTCKYLIDNKLIEKTSELSLQQMSLGCTFTFKNLKSTIIPNIQNGTVHFQDAELHYTGVRR
jgi:hypothetical protein